MHQNHFALSVRILIIVGFAFMASTTGCEKVPTFQELTQQGQNTPAAPTSPVDTVKPVPAQQPVAPVVVAPVVEDPQRVIAEFKNKASYARKDQDLARIASLPSGLDMLTEMDLTASSVTDDGLKHLTKLTNLEFISLGSTNVTSVGLSFISELPKMIKLNLSGCTVTLPMMEAISKLDKLEVLGLSAKLGDNELPPLTKMPGLKVLDLSTSLISDNGFKTLGTLKNLEVLNVSGTTITGSGMQFMKRNKTEVGLRILNASKTRFGEQGLQFLKGAQTLEELNISEAQVTDRTLALHLKGVTHLKKLNLGANQISDQGTQVLGGIRSLEELSLGYCTRITDVTLSFLKNNKELRILDVNACGNVSLKGGQALKKFLPDCEIHIAGTKL